ncbi:hypothetical protein ACXR8U_08300 [Methylobacterium radiotolerans]|jgi:hypothetical protein|uniref:hypothetical protein n=1 Tax=Methylobacterium TaxID=407 RepID=UPI00041FACA7|nr:MULTISPECIES: hypothetical protein [Methylobacterium]KZC03567.1 hypothetical protein AU375_00159 [Methylobacterium radiotolerans]MBN6821648.1 hypothetical protein [Methylobacterium organophilum]OXE38311.1 hypothetical protein CCS92_29895 [Methylobacterium radiotolerans]GAN50482.1 hypothetical protein ME121_4528 [Methylobacterium sp. ME121]
MDDEEHDFEHSPLSGLFTRDGHEVEVEIYRLAGTQDRWRMEVVHLSGCSRWQDTFASDADAHAAFLAAVEAAGIGPFVGYQPEAVN